MTMGYTIDEHRHRFATWAAARAMQRGLYKTQEIAYAIDHCGIMSVVKNRPQWPNSIDVVDRVQKRLCNRFIRELTLYSHKEPTYGRAAKVVAVYFKVAIVLGGFESTQFGKLLNPPIDRLLLHALMKHSDCNEGFIHKWKNVSWTKLDDRQYFSLVNDLRRLSSNEAPFWRIERFWQAGFDK